MLKQKMLEWATGIDANKKDAAKVAGEAVVRLLNLSSRIIFQIPNEKDHPIVRGIKCVAIADSVYKCLIKGENDEKEKGKDEETPVDPEEVVPEQQRILMLPPAANSKF